MVIVFILCLLAGIAMMIRGAKKNSDLICGWGIVITIAGIILTFLAWPIIYVDSYMNLTKMEAFYDANRDAYETTVEHTRNALYYVAKDAGFRIDVENMKQSTNWSERLAELRDAVVEYNTCIYKLRRYNRTFVLSAMFANPRPDLKLIILRE